MVQAIFQKSKQYGRNLWSYETIEKAAQLYMLIAHLPHINTIRDDELKAVAEAFGLNYRKDFLNL